MADCRRDGIELCRELLRLQPEAKVIFYSADIRRTSRDEALAAGAIDFVLKPDIERLLESMNQASEFRSCSID